MTAYGIECCLTRYIPHMMSLSLRAKLGDSTATDAQKHVPPTNRERADHSLAYKHHILSCMYAVAACCCLVGQPMISASPHAFDVPTPLLVAPMVAAFDSHVKAAPKQ